jgi:peptide deformylase
MKEVKMITTNIDKLRMKTSEVSLEESESIIPILEKELINGVGLAAPQIEIPKKVAIIRHEDYSINLINPEIISYEDPFIFEGEACLSIPDKEFNTRRYKKIVVRDLISGEKEIEGFLAVIYQHEIDHLNNILLFDRDITRKMRNEKCPCHSGKKWKKCHGRF